MNKIKLYNSINIDLDRGITLLIIYFILKYYNIIKYKNIIIDNYKYRLFCKIMFPKLTFIKFDVKNINYKTNFYFNINNHLVNRDIFIDYFSNYINTILPCNKIYFAPWYNHDNPIIGYKYSKNKYLYYNDKYHTIKKFNNYFKNTQLTNNIWDKTVEYNILNKYKLYYKFINMYIVYKKFYDALIKSKKLDKLNNTYDAVSNISSKIEKNTFITNKSPINIFPQLNTTFTSSSSSLLVVKSISSCDSSPSNQSLKSQPSKNTSALILQQSKVAHENSNINSEIEDTTCIHNKSPINEFPQSNTKCISPLLFINSTSSDDSSLNQFLKSQPSNNTSVLIPQQPTVAQENTNMSSEIEKYTFINNKSPINEFSESEKTSTPPLLVVKSTSLDDQSSNQSLKSQLSKNISALIPKQSTLAHEKSNISSEIEKHKYINNKLPINEFISSDTTSTTPFTVIKSTLESPPSKNTSASTSDSALITPPSKVVMKAINLPLLKLTSVPKKTFKHTTIPKEEPPKLYFSPQQSQNVINKPATPVQNIKIDNGIIDTLSTPVDLTVSATDNKNNTDIKTKSELVNLQSYPQVHPTVPKNPTIPKSAFQKSSFSSQESLLNVSDKLAGPVKNMNTYGELSEELSKKVDDTVVDTTTNTYNTYSKAKAKLINSKSYPQEQPAVSKKFIIPDGAPPKSQLNIFKKPSEPSQDIKIVKKLKKKPSIDPHQIKSTVPKPAILFQDTELSNELIKDTNKDVPSTYIDNDINTNTDAAVNTSNIDNDLKSQFIKPNNNPKYIFNQHPQLQPYTQVVPQAQLQVLPQAQPQVLPQAQPQVLPQAQLQAQAQVQAQPQVLQQAQPQANSQVLLQPQEYPQVLPQPQAQPQAYPQVLPQAQPQVQAQSQAHPQVLPQAQPQVQAQSQAHPQVLPQPQPQAYPQVLPQPQAQPQAYPQVLPQAQPQAYPQVLPQAQPQPQPQEYPQVLPQVQPQEYPQVLPQSQPQEYPQVLPQSQPQEYPQVLPQSQPQEYPQVLPQPQPQEYPQVLPQPQLQEYPQVLPQAQPQPLKEDSISLHDNESNKKYTTDNCNKLLKLLIEKIILLETLNKIQDHTIYVPNNIDKLSDVLMEKIGLLAQITEIKQQNN
uniref:Uncharacterized protein n=1 Tax=viral metagenome TaxID=1070528 RepID=A0A6C0H821_9ZZZZ